MRVPPALLRAGFVALTASRARRFAAALRHPANAQHATLRRISRLIAGSPYAKHVGLRGGIGYAEFARRVPLVGYEDLRPWVERQVATGTPQLSREAAVVYERTSGSAGRPKLVPYPPALLASFSSCFEIWAHDLVAHGPRLRTGRMFLSVSPAGGDEERTPTGTPVSLADDTGYLAPRYQRLLHRCIVAPPALKRIGDGAAYRRALATTLVARSDLEIVSVWSPTYLLALFDTIATARDGIAADLRRGQTGAPDVAISLPPVPAERLALLARDPIPWERLWPELKLISCWTDAGSAPFATAVRKALPGVLLQGKGLLATEAPITVPLLGAEAPVPLLDEVFLEFVASDGDVRRLHELTEGETYVVVATQAGGLLRYQTGDRVRVEGRVAATPCLRFVGREGRVSDLVGEKLDELLARAAIAEVFGADAHCSFLVPEPGPSGPPHYRCVTDHPAAVTNAPGLAARLDGELARSFQYAQARRLGQLGALVITHRADARAAYERFHLARGRRWGNVKFEALLPALSGLTAGG